jgi:hypothetical protein
MTLDDRDYYRTLSDYALVAAAREDGVTVEMAVVLAERLSDRVLGNSPNIQPRSIKA